MMFNTPFTQPQQFFAAWQSMMTGQAGRLEDLASQMADAEQSAMTRATEAIDEYAKLMKASLRYNQQLASAWRSQVIEVSKTATAAVDTTTNVEA
jgi:hypothetical protein